ncbi:MAG: hypothetical protein K0R73_1225 [Candidatus Midichloriaceae bacterium]|jgi:hypothetical protein|nr:hypothetical protein [Candidatus Midichloriaceae bacterium]
MLIMHLSRNIEYFLLRSSIAIIDNELSQYNNSIDISQLAAL